MASERQHSGKVPKQVFRVNSKVFLYPNETVVVKLNTDLKEESRVSFTPRRAMLNAGLAPGILKVKKDRTVEIVNESDNLIQLKKDEHLGDFRAVVSQEEALLANLHREDPRISLAEQQGYNTTGGAARKDNTISRSLTSGAKSFALHS